MSELQRQAVSTGTSVQWAACRLAQDNVRRHNTGRLGLGWVDFIVAFLPKGSDLSVFSQQELDDIAWKLNTRPRKSLNWKCLAEPFLPEGAFDFKAYWADKLNLVALRL